MSDGEIAGYIGMFLVLTVAGFVYNSVQHRSTPSKYWPFIPALVWILPGAAKLWLAMVLG